MPSKLQKISVFFQEFNFPLSLFFSLSVTSGNWKVLESMQWCQTVVPRKARVVEFLPLYVLNFHVNKAYSFIILIVYIKAFLIRETKRLCSIKPETVLNMFKQVSALINKTTGYFFQSRKHEKSHQQLLKHLYNAQGKLQLDSLKNFNLF